MSYETGIQIRRVWGHRKYSPHRTRTQHFFLVFAKKYLYVKIFILSTFRRGRRAATVRGGGGGVPRDHDAGRHGQQAATRAETAEGASGMGSESGWVDIRRIILTAFKISKETKCSVEHNGALKWWYLLLPSTAAMSSLGSVGSRNREKETGELDPIF